MSERRAIVHIGMPKTGSTSIQNWLSNSSDLLKSYGWYYGRVPMKRLPYRHSQIEYAICGLASAERLFPDAHIRTVFRIPDLEAQANFAKNFDAALARWLSRTGAKNVVISSEHISAAYSSQEQVKSLDSWLHRHFSQVSYVIYLRRQEDWVLSQYSQALRFGTQETLDEFVRRRKVKDYMQLVARWQNVVHPERISVRLLESDTLVGRSLSADFASLLGIDVGKVGSSKRLNESFSVEGAEVLRRWNAKLSSKGDLRLDDPRRWKVVKLLGRDVSPDRRLTLSQEQSRMIHEANALSNESLREACFPHRNILFRPVEKSDSGGVRLPHEAELADLAATLADNLCAELTLAPNPITSARHVMHALYRRFRDAGRMLESAFGRQ